MTAWHQTIRRHRQAECWLLPYPEVPISSVNAMVRIALLLQARHHLIRTLSSILSLALTEGFNGDHLGKLSQDGSLQLFDPYEKVHEIAKVAILVHLQGLCEQYCFLH